MKTARVGSTRPNGKAKREESDPTQDYIEIQLEFHGAAKPVLAINYYLRGLFHHIIITKRKSINLRILPLYEIYNRPLIIDLTMNQIMFGMNKSEIHYVMNGM